MPDPASSPARRTRRGPVLGALVLAMFMAAIEGTIVATAMPSIAGSLGGFALYGWVFASYLLMQAATTPMFGKLADLYGRKSVFTLGVTVFMAGSVACGFATSMPWLIAFRFVQGAGAGAVQPVTNTLAGDLFAFRERARVQGWLASVWGFSAILGPLAGGLIVEHAHWAWIFWANVPFGLLALGLVTTYLHEDVRRTERRIDHAGAVTFFVGIAALITVLTQFGTFPAWLSLALLALSATSLSFFAWHETRAPDAMMPPDLWRDRLVTTANLGTLGAGIVMIAVISYLPTYAQGVLGTSALVAGFTLTTMSMGWPLAAVVAGRLMVHVGVRTTVRAGGLALVLGATGFALLDRVREAWFAAAASAVVGVGMGLLITTFLVSVQTRVSWRRRGAATATNALMRILGNALGAALLGGVVNASVASYLRREGLAGRVSLDDVTRLLTERAATEPALLARVSTGLAQGLDRAFLVMLTFAVITLAICLTMPDLRPEETGGRPTETSGPGPPDDGGDRGPGATRNRRSSEATCVSDE